MHNRETQVCRAYLENVFTRATTPLEGEPFQPDWADKPSVFKIYRRVERLPLPLTQPRISMAEIYAHPAPPLDARSYFTKEEVATMLYFSLAPLKRKLEI